MWCHLFLNWGRAALQGVVRFSWTVKWISDVHTYSLSLSDLPPTHAASHPARPPQSSELSPLSDMGGCVSTGCLLHTRECVRGSPRLWTITLLSPPGPHVCSLYLHTYSCLQWFIWAILYLFLPAMVHLDHSSGVHIYALTYNIWFSLSDLLHCVWQSLGPSTSLQMIQFHSF